MAGYTKVDSKIIQEILDLYDLKGASGTKVKTFEAKTHGISNSNYEIELENGLKLLLKISNDKSVDELKEEMLLLKVLNEVGFTYSLCSFQLKNGENVYQYGPYHGVLFPFVEGQVRPPSDQVCFEIGRALGSMQVLPASTHDQFRQIRSHRKVGQDAADIDDFVRSEGCPQDFKDIFFSLFPQSIKGTGYLQEIFPQGILHGDLYYDNVLFGADGKVAKILDFEQGGRGPFIFDLGVCISGSCLKDGEIDQQLLGSFLQGLESVRKLYSFERKHLRTSILVGLFSISRWRIKRFMENGLDESKRHSYQELILRAKKFAQLP